MNSFLLTGGGGKKQKQENASRRKYKSASTTKEVKTYVHNEKRPNNPEVGVADRLEEPDIPDKKAYEIIENRPYLPEFNPVEIIGYDLDKDLHIEPTLMWAGKYQDKSLEVDIMPIHVHERIDPISIIEKITNKNRQSNIETFFGEDERKLGMANVLQFYKHENNWSNRFIVGDSLVVMNSLLVKEGMGGKMQMVYIDPPYGINYRSNFQPYVCSKDTKNKNSDENLTGEGEMIHAFRDTWEKGIHSYLTYLRDRLILAHKLLNESGSCFVQISSEHVHRVRLIIDEIFGTDNFCSIIYYRTKSSPQETKTIFEIGDSILWYAKNRERVKRNHLYIKKNINDAMNGEFRNVELPNHEITTVNALNGIIPDGAKLFRTQSILTKRVNKDRQFEFKIGNKIKKPLEGTSWQENEEGMKNLLKKGRLLDNNAMYRIYKQYYDDIPYDLRTNVWLDSMGAIGKNYVVQTSDKVIQNCILMTTDPGDLVFDPTCGGGTTALTAEKFGRRWITCDTSRISITIAKQSLLTRVFDYYRLNNFEKGVCSGIVNKTFSRKTMRQIANDEERDIVELIDQPKTQIPNGRVTGPFTVEAIPPPVAKSIDMLYDENIELISEKGNVFQKEWREMMLQNGIRGKNNQKIEFIHLSQDSTTKWIHAIGETKDDPPKQIAVVFGPEYKPMSYVQVISVIVEANGLKNKPELIIFAAISFDPLAITEMEKSNVGEITMLPIKINEDVLTKDLKKKDAKNEPFWLLGQPDVCVSDVDGKKVVEVIGYDYFDVKTGKIDAGGKSKIVMWLLDPDYDSKSICPQQMFFPMEGSTGRKGWKNLSELLKSVIDEELAENYVGTKSIPFEVGERKLAAVKIIDDRGIESLKILELE